MISAKALHVLGLALGVTGVFPRGKASREWTEANCRADDIHQDRLDAADERKKALPPDKVTRQQLRRERALAAKKKPAKERFSNA